MSVREVAKGESAQAAAAVVASLIMMKVVAALARRVSQGPRATARAMAVLLVPEMRPGLPPVAVR
jgi:hypothetical protein